MTEPDRYFLLGMAKGCSLILFGFLLCGLWLSGQAGRYSLLIRGGHVIDPKNQIDGIRDVAIADGKIARVEAGIPPGEAQVVVEAPGLFIVPGLIDIHAHVFFGTEPDAYLSNSYSSVPPDGFTFRTGVTTVADAGGAGWRNFNQFKRQVIDRSQTRVLSFLNIVGSGMRGGAVEQNLADMDPKLTAMVVRQFPKTIVGVKVAHYQGPEWDPVDRAVEAGRLGGVPIMVDFGGHTPELSLKDLLLVHLRPGDMLTHTYAHVRGRIPIVDEAGKLNPFVREARTRGVIFDVGHGGGSFVFRQVIPAMRQGFQPDSISTDLHTGSMNAGMKEMINVMSKFLNLGMSLPDVILRSTWNPARQVGRTDLGNLDAGAVADIAVLGVRDGKFGLVDSEGSRMDATRKLECELTVREGRVVWDLNGISRPNWDKPGAGRRR